jgi:hypothetical protein
LLQKPSRGAAQRQKHPIDASQTVVVTLKAFSDEVESVEDLDHGEVGSQASSTVVVFIQIGVGWTRTAALSIGC